MPKELTFSYFYSPQELNYKEYWTSNEGNGYSYYRKSISKRIKSKNSNIINIEEAFIITPLKDERECFVIYISRLEIGSSIHAIFRDKIRIKRMKLLLGLKNYIIDYKHNSIYNNNNINKKITLEQRIKGYNKINNSFICFDKEIISTQRFLFFRLFKEFIMGKGKIKCCLPIKMLEPKSLFAKITEGFCNAPFFLTKAADSTDPLERLKYAIAFIISGLHSGIFYRKPFDPLLGETYQGVFQDGTEISMEQISLSPPTTYFLVNICLLLLLL